MSRVPAVPQVPASSRAQALTLVFAGGMVGTALRSAIDDGFSRPDALLPWATFVINVSGAALLGLLVQLVALRWRGASGRRLRLALGTGLLGGYTTYSTFIIESVRLGSDRELVAALLYDAASLTLGFLAAFTVMAAVRSWDRRRPGQPPASATGDVG